MPSLHPRTRTRERAAAGFTLAEMMIVLAMIGILSAVAFSYTGESTGSLRGFAAQIAGEADATRMRALSSRRWQRVRFDAEARELVIEQATLTGMPEPEDDEWQTVNTLDVPRSATVHSIATTANVVDGDGIPTAGDGLDQALYFAPDGSSRARTIYLEASDGRGAQARVVVYRATGSAWPKERW